MTDSEISQTQSSIRNSPKKPNNESSHTFHEEQKKGFFHTTYDKTSINQLSSEGNENQPKQA
jgi:hypothetical protein